MPSRYVIRNFIDDGYYHVYNRGVEKRVIFLDEQDYNMLLYYLFIYLMPPKEIIKKYPNLPFRLQGKNLHGQIELIAYCFMPNHFHFLIKQRNKTSISKFIKQLTNAYTLYFNQKYKRVGALMQGRFKAVGIDNYDLLLHVSRYIHLNPVVSGLIVKPSDYEYSSYKDFTGEKGKIYCYTEEILGENMSSRSYQSFVIDQIGFAKELELIKHLVIEA